MQDKVLRNVSPAFQEDPVRILRLARFADFALACQACEKGISADSATWVMKVSAAIKAIARTATEGAELCQYIKATAH